jgi:ribonuclease-3
MKLLNDLNISTNNIKLYETALTHTSYINEEVGESYERLEYLGDAVLELIITEYLYNKYPDMLEGKMTKTRAKYVCENSNFQYATKLGLDKYIKLGQGERQSGLKVSIVADTFESFIGALYLDQGFNYVKKFIYHHIISEIEHNNIELEEDYKSLLQEFVQTDKRTLTYEVVNEVGPQHDKTFTIIVKIDDIIYGTGSAKSKKEAEQEAAKNALKKCVRRV